MNVNKANNESYVQRFVYQARREHGEFDYLPCSEGNETGYWTAGNQA